MKKSILSITVVTVFSLSALTPAMVAAAPCAPGLVFDNNQCVNPGLASPSAQFKLYKRKAAAERTKKVKKDTDKKTDTDRTKDTTDTTTVTNPPTPGPQASAAEVSAYEKVNKVEKGSIVVLTYVDDPQKDSKGNYDQRIGNVQVKVDRLDGDQKCVNRKAKEAKTNAKREMKNSDGETIFTKGSANYRMCNVGEYKVTLVGRDGYTPLGKTTSTFKLKNNDIRTVKFVVKKNAKTKKTKAKKTTLNDLTSVVAPRFS